MKWCQFWLRQRIPERKPCHYGYRIIKGNPHRDGKPQPARRCSNCGRPEVPGAAPDSLS